MSSPHRVETMTLYADGEQLAELHNVECSLEKLRESSAAFVGGLHTATAQLRMLPGATKALARLAHLLDVAEQDARLTRKKARRWLSRMAEKGHTVRRKGRRVKRVRWPRTVARLAHAAWGVVVAEAAWRLEMAKEDGDE